MRREQSLGLIKSPHITKLIFFHVIKADRVLLLPQRELDQYLASLAHVPAVLQAAKWQWDGGAVMDVLQKALECKKMGEEASNSLLHSTAQQRIWLGGAAEVANPHLMEMVWMATLSCSVFTPLHEASWCCEACVAASPPVLSAHCRRAPGGRTVLLLRLSYLQQMWNAFCCKASLGKKAVILSLEMDPVGNCSGQPCSLTNSASPGFVY